MNEIDILKSIADNLSVRNSSAALNNYLVLCNNIKFVNDLFVDAINSLTAICKDIEHEFSSDLLLKEELKDPDNPLYYFKRIIPRILLNDVSILEKFSLVTSPDNREGITLEEIYKLGKDFTDYNNLVTTVRQVIDGLVLDSYQLVKLDPKETNYHVLESLNSFSKYATKSIRKAFFNTEIENSIAEFNKLSYKNRLNSSITRCANKTFGDKLDFLFTQLRLATEGQFKGELKNIFKFASEFTHVGYVSTFFSSTSGAEVIFGDEIGPYLPSTENFSELKYQLLETTLKFLGKLYLPALIYSLKKLFKDEVSLEYEKSINEVIEHILKGLQTRNNKYYFFIVKNLIESSEVIDLNCRCGTVNKWTPPHDMMRAYCKGCGSEFSFLVLEGDPGYIITSDGPVKVIGSNAPDLDELPLECQIELIKQTEELIKSQK
jgi:hypothetical protein